MPHRVSIGELGENDHSSSELMGHLIIYNPLCNGRNNSKYNKSIACSNTAYYNASIPTFPFITYSIIAWVQ